MNHQNLVSTGLTVVLWAIFAWYLGKAVWMPFHNNSSHVSVWKPTTAAHSGTQKVFDSRFVKQQNLFGEFNRSSKPVQNTVMVNAPKTKLNLKLVGVVVSDEIHGNLAIIALRGEQDTYGLDESIKGTRASLKAVLADRVIINNSGRDETLMLENIDPKLYQQMGPIRNKAHTPGKFTEHTRHTSDKKLAQIKQELSNNPQNLFQYVRLSQIKRNNAVIGYRLSPGRSPELFKSVGLKRGDIAVKLNDVDLTDKNAMVKISSELSDLSEMKITVERDGQPHDIYIQF
ncbi:type II secretion system protein GspC [Vibrio quintilis]|uniref:type II secretion system protein GspC n=1 Tax=Vibrio quintilis TaxID=1117707 RepID=UPI0013565E40|nr:type II secretion system protein GspC [Vibrio quintilis]